jgi:hypothetical protein
MFEFNAHGTEGLELFTWIVAGLVGIGAGVVFAHFLKTKEDEKEEKTEH